MSEICKIAGLDLWAEHIHKSSVHVENTVRRNVQKMLKTLKTCKAAA